MDDIRLCERCCSKIGSSEPHVQYAHVIDTHSDGTPEFSYAYVHHPKVAQCVPEAATDAA